MTDIPGHGSRPQALLVLEDGTVFKGVSCGAPGERVGEIVVDTSMTSHQETITDAAYAGQIVVMTAPHVGVYGVNAVDMESRGVAAEGFVVREVSLTTSNWRAEESLPAFWHRSGVVAITGVDTRRLTRHLRGRGLTRAVVSTVDDDPASLVAKARTASLPSGDELVSRVATTDRFTWGSEMGQACEVPVDTGVLPVSPRYRVAVLDTGARYSVLRKLAESGCEVVVLPPDTTAADALALDPDGVFIGGGPGDPASLTRLVDTMRDLVGVRPVFGAGLGHQVLAIAMGGATRRLANGHRGSGRPVKNLVTGAVEITSQNHGFSVDFGSIGPLMLELSGSLGYGADDYAAWVAAGVAPVVCSGRFGPVQLTHVDLNDMTVAGIRLLEAPAFSVQYRPEAVSETRADGGLFGEFARLMEGRSDLYGDENGE